MIPCEAMSYSRDERTNITYIPEAEAVALQPQLELSTNVTQFPVEAVPVVESTICHTEANETHGTLAAPVHNRGQYSYLAGGRVVSQVAYSTAPSSLPAVPIIVNRSNLPESVQAVPGGEFLNSPSMDIQNIPLAEASVVGYDRFYGNHATAAYALGGLSMNNTNNNTHDVPLSLSDRSTHRNAAYVSNPLPSSTLWQSNQNEHALPSRSSNTCYVRPGSSMKPYI